MPKCIKYGICCLLCLFFVNEINAQRNVLKHNIYGHLNFLDAVKVYGLSFESAIKEKFSWSISGGYGVYRRDETSVVTTGTTERLEFRGLDITPELRWYIFSNETKIAPLGFFIGPYVKLMFLEEEYTRLVSDNFDKIASEKGWLGGLGFSGGYKLGTDPIVLEILGGFGWGIESGFVDEAIIDPQFARLNRKFMLARLEFSLGFLF